TRGRRWRHAWPRGKRTKRSRAPRRRAAEASSRGRQHDRRSAIVSRRPKADANKTRAPGINTVYVHGGDDGPRAQQALRMPIIQTATYAFADTADLIHFMQQKTWGDGIEGREEYGRYGNPTVHAVEAKVAALEGAGDAVLFSSGMAAITSLLLASLPSGA